MPSREMARNTRRAADLASPDHVCAAERCTGFGDPACGCACHTMEHFLFGDVLDA